MWTENSRKLTVKDVAKWLLKPLILQRYTNVLGSTNGSKVYDDLRKLRHGTRGTYSAYLRYTCPRCTCSLLNTSTWHVHVLRSWPYVPAEVQAKYRLGSELVYRVRVIATLVFLVGRKIHGRRLFFLRGCDSTSWNIFTMKIVIPLLEEDDSTNRKKSRSGKRNLNQRTKYFALANCEFHGNRRREKWYKTMLKRATKKERPTRFFQ